MNFSALVYVEKLKLRQRNGQISVPCPFHVDTLPSLAINLDKAIHFCHGACDEPRGGGPADFLMKWARVREGRTLTRAQARHELRREFVVMDAASLRREYARREVELFCEYMALELAVRAKFVERAIRDVNAYCDEYPKERGADDVWSMLVLLHGELRWADAAMRVCHAKTITLETITLLDECTRRGWWTLDTKIYARQLQAFHESERAFRRQAEELQRCPESPSRSNPSSPHTPATATVHREPVPRRHPVSRF